MNVILERLRQEEILARNGGHPILERSFTLGIAEIERLQDALREAFTLIEERDGHVPERLRLIAMGAVDEQSLDKTEAKP